MVGVFVPLIVVLEDTDGFADTDEAALADAVFDAVYVVVAVRLVVGAADSVLVGDGDTDGALVADVVLLAVRLPVDVTVADFVVDVDGACVGDELLVFVTVIVAEVVAVPDLEYDIDGHALCDGDVLAGGVLDAESDIVPVRVLVNGLEGKNCMCPAHKVKARNEIIGVQYHDRRSCARTGVYISFHICIRVQIPFKSNAHACTT